MEQKKCSRVLWKLICKAFFSVPDIDREALSSSHPSMRRRQRGSNQTQMWKYLPFIKRRPTMGLSLVTWRDHFIQFGQNLVDCMRLLPPSVNEMEIRYVRGNNTRAWTNYLKTQRGWTAVMSQQWHWECQINGMSIMIHVEHYYDAT